MALSQDDLRDLRDSYKKPKPRENQPYTFLDIAGWDENPPPPRPWAVQDRIPLRQPTLFSGEGAIGKSVVELQLCVAHPLGLDWLGSMPEPGPAIYLGAEEEADEIHRRLVDILAFHGKKFSDLNGHLHMLSRAGEDAILAAPNRDGKVVPTPLYEWLLEMACDIKPKHIGIDTSADVYAGSEIDRAQVRQFVGLLRKMAIAANSSVVLLSHPSLTGINSKSGISGSTGWHNSVRARMYLRAPDKSENGEDEQPKTDLRILEFMKNNYGPISHTVPLQYRNGLFLPVASPSEFEKAARGAKIDNDLTDRLKAYDSSGYPLSANPCAPNYAPRIIAEQPECKAAGFSKSDIEAAMHRLLQRGDIKIIETGPPSKRRQRIVLNSDKFP
jgi:RecA-family ATPase